MSEKPRIALMSYAMDNRTAKGTALYTRKLIERLIEDPRYEWHLVHFEKVDDPLYEKAHEIIMPRIPVLPFGTRFLRTMLFFWEFRNNQFDLIHWFQPRLYPFFWMAPAKKIVVTAHAAGDITAPGKFPLSRRIFNFVMINFSRYIAAIIAVSNFGKREIVEYYRASEEKVHTIYNGGGEDFHLMEKSEAQARIASRYHVATPFILDVSRLELYKNVARLIKAYDMARHRSSFPHSLVVVGYPGSASGEVEHAKNSSQFSKQIQTIDYVAPEDLNALYAAADLLVFPSLNEGFGLPIVEAFAVGTPVVTSSTGGLSEIAEDAAELVDPMSEADIARGVEAVLNEEQKKAQLVSKGFERAKTFTWRRCADATLALYASLLA